MSPVTGVAMVLLLLCCRGDVEWINQKKMMPYCKKVDVVRNNQA